MTCASCGYENPSDARFCAGCGTQLAEQTAEAGLAEAAGEIRDAPEQLANGRYRLKGYLGEGARKVVYLAHDSALEREVAIAMLKTDDLDRAGRHQLAREAQAMARLGDHPNVVSVFDIGDDDGEPYIVSQYMAGGSLDKRLEEAVDNRLPLDEAIEVATSMAAALDHAHRRGVVHRDLKPSNVWLTADGIAQLGDFGLAFSADRTRLTRAGAIVGTVSYMAPEQALGKTPDACSDLYSLGALLYEMLTGRPPFVGDTAVSVISQHTSAEPVAPSRHNPEVPSELEAVVLKLLEKDPDERYADAGALRAALQSAREAAERPAPEDGATAGAENPVEALAEGVFVGREKEVERLRGAFEDALAARGRLMMLVGEPGIGKTRTAQELTTYAQLRGARVLVGRAYEGEGAPAYWPWVQIARTYMEGRPKDEIKADMGPGAIDIAQVVGEVRGVLPENDFGETANPADSEQARFRLFDSVTTFLRNASKREPLVIVLDDLHWADTPSLLLLEFMARELGGARLLIVGTYRDVELGRKHPLSRVLADLARESLVERVLLRGLTQPDVARFIEMTASIRPPERLVRTVHEETEGNPFFVSEIVSLLASEGHLESGSALGDVLVTIPQGVREVVGRRLDRLSDHCNWVLSAACVLGRDFAVDVLAPVVCDEALVEFPGKNPDDLTRERLLEVLDEAVAARVLQIADVGRYTFSHALVRESLYEELGVTRRVRLHRRVGETIESVFGKDSDQHLEQLAHHFLQAQELDKAVDYSIHAAGRAMSLMAYEDGAALYDRALQALDLRGGVSGQQRAELLIALGDAQARAGDGQRAKETFFRAADAARSVGAQDQLARAALGVAGRLEIGLVEREVIELVEEALAGCGDEPSAARAELMASLAMALYFVSRERADELSAAAVEMAREAGDDHVLAHALSARHFSLWQPERLDERLAVATELVDVAGASGDLDHKVDGRGLKVIDLLELGDIRAADAEMEAYGREAHELRQPNYLRIAAIRSSMRAILAGRFDEAERMFAETPTLDRAKRLLEPNTVQAGAVVLFELRRLQGRLSEVRGAFETFSKEYPAVPAWRAALALVYAEVGSFDEARAELRELARDEIAALQRDANWLVGMVCLSLTAVRLGERMIATTAYEQMLPYADRNVVVGGGWSCEGSASLYLGYLAAFLQRFEAAEQHFRAALQMNESIGARPFVAETQVALAELIAERDGSAGERRATELADAGLEAARDIGMAGLVERAFSLKMRFQGIDPADVSTSIDAVASAVGNERPDLTTATAADGTVTIMFSDIESSTEMTERMGDRRWIEVLREHNRLVRDQLAAHEGFEVKSQGDGFMVAFASASKAVECAAAIQRAFAQHAEETPDEAIRVRIGLHTGEAIRERDDFFGRNVILAARIAAKANGGEVLVSSLLKELTEAEADVRFGEPRELSLKGLSGTYQVHAVDWEGLVAGAAG
ncbi:MAG: eukaryotic-like serine/threonine-protein kinase [Thermoleophilaceae bacterium]|nr:eukaryotic-like serine/threonine-protein kinase [Thermoleophilaceae bacterium]